MKSVFTIIGVFVSVLSLSQGQKVALNVSGSVTLRVSLGIPESPLAYGPNTHFVGDFGAIGDGVTDDTEEINAAIQAAEAGDTVLLGAGTYLVRNSFIAGSLYQPKGIRLKDSIVFRGIDSSVSIIKAAPPPEGAEYNNTTHVTNSEFYPVVWGDNVSRVVIRDLKVNGDKDNQINWNADAFNTPAVLSDGSPWDEQVSTKTSTGVHFIGGAHNIIDNVSVINAAAGGVMIEGCAYTLVKNSYFRANNWGAVNYYSSHKPFIDNITAYGNNCDGVRFAQDSDSATIINSEISHGISNPFSGYDYAGVYVEKAAPIVVNNNHLHDMPSYGVDCYHAGDPWKFGIAITDNTIEYNGHGGINLIMNTSTIAGNTVKLRREGEDYARAKKGINIYNDLGGFWAGTMTVSENNFDNRTFSDLFIVIERHDVHIMEGNTITNNACTGTLTESVFYNPGYLNPATNTITGNTFP